MIILFSGYLVFLLMSIESTRYYCLKTIPFLKVVDSDSQRLAASAKRVLRTNIKGLKLTHIFARCYCRLHG